jgi:hypothetical protein
MMRFAVSSTNVAGVPAAWVPRASDEFLHQPDGDPGMPWKETWFVGAYDLANGFALSLHMTVSPERPDDTRVAVAVRLGAREGLGVRTEAGCSDHDVFGNSLAQLRVVHSSWNSDHELQLVGDVDGCSFDLVLRGNHWATLWDTMFPGFYQSGQTSSHSYGHAEQSLSFSGTVGWSGAEPTAVDGWGWRDRGWGRRRSTSSFSAGYDMVDGVLADGGVFTLMAFRNPDLPADSPLPLGGWYSNDSTLVPAVSGTFWKDSIGWPERIELTFADGRAFRSRLHRRHFSIAVPFHDAAHELVSAAHGIRDYFGELIDSDGAVFPMHANSGHMHVANVTASSTFVFADPAEGTSNGSEEHH